MALALIVELMAMAPALAMGNGGGGWTSDLNGREGDCEVADGVVVMRW